MTLDSVLATISDQKCRFGLHDWQPRWSKREKSKAAFNETIWLQFKTCRHCEAVKVRQV